MMTQEQSELLRTLVTGLRRAGFTGGWLAWEKLFRLGGTAPLIAASLEL